MSIILPNVFISYPHVFKAVPPKGSTVPKFSAQFITPQDFDWDPVKAAIEQAKVDFWGGQIPPDLKSTVSQVSEQGIFFNHWQIGANAYENSPPELVDQNIAPIMDQRNLFAGCRVHAEVYFKGYDSGSNGIRCNLLKIMLVDNENVTRLDGQKSAQEVFASIPGAPPVPRKERARCPILLYQGKIIWVAGYRIDESVKVKPSTKNVLKVELSLA